MVASTTWLTRVMRISTLKMDHTLMLVTDSEARAQDARQGSARPVVYSYFRHRGCPWLLARGVLFVFLGQETLTASCFTHCRISRCWVVGFGSCDVWSWQIFIE
jgi:hypothetical protein